MYTLSLPSVLYIGFDISYISTMDRAHQVLQLNFFCHIETVLMLQ